jgi:hypothetical protein
MERDLWGSCPKQEPLPFFFFTNSVGGDTISDSKPFHRKRALRFLWFLSEPSELCPFVGKTPSLSTCFRD